MPGSRSSRSRLPPRPSYEKCAKSSLPPTTPHAKPESEPLTSARPRFNFVRTFQDRARDRAENHPHATGWMRKILSILIWGAIAALGAAGFAVLALSRGETVNAAWLLTAAVCTYAVGYRFYSRFLAYKVFGLDDTRATPAERLDRKSVV